MTQMDLSEFELVNVDYDGTNLPPTVQLFKPVLYKNGTEYYCLLGADPQEGVFGCGETPQEAVLAWERHLKELIHTTDRKNQMMQYISGHLIGTRVSPARPGFE